MSVALPRRWENAVSSADSQAPAYALPGHVAAELDALASQVLACSGQG